MDCTGSRLKLDALTGLRYCAAMTVVLSHVAGGERHLAKSFLAQLSAIGMPLFFTLSGFLMCYNYYAIFTEGREGALRRFYVARIARVYPTYLIALLLSFSFMGNFFHDAHNRPGETASCLAFAGTLTQSWIHSPAFSDYHNPRSLSQAYLGVAWSVSTEMFFYLTFPLAIPLLKRLSRPRTVIVAMATIFAAYALFDLWYLRGAKNIWQVVTSHSFERWLLYLSPYGRIGEFLMGCLTGRLFAITATRDPLMHPQAKPQSRFVPWVIGGCVVLMFAFSQLLGRQLFAIDQLSLNVGLAPLCCLLIYCLARYSSGLERFLGSKLFVLLGESSYCLFLFHPLIQSFFAPRTIGEGGMTVWYVLTYNHLAMMFVLHVMAMGFYQFVELPLREKIRNRFSPIPQGATIRMPETAPSIRLAA